MVMMATRLSSEEFLSEFHKNKLLGYHDYLKDQDIRKFEMGLNASNHADFKANATCRATRSINFYTANSSMKYITGAGNSPFRQL